MTFVPEKSVIFILKQKSVLLTVFCLCVGRGRRHIRTVSPQECAKTSPWVPPWGRAQIHSSHACILRSEKLCLLGAPH